MIYFFNNDLELKKIVHSENVIATNHEHELNNLTIFDVSMDLSYAKQFIDDVDHMGYYYRDEFYLHKINSVEENHADESINVHGRHKFFDDMLFGQLIMDFRPENRDALFILRQAIDNHTDWQTVMTDTTGTLSTNFYRQVPYEALEWVMENFRLEFKPVILFDGQNINGLQLQVAKQIGEDKNIRVPFGDRVENMEYDIDYSEIVTKMAVHGKGEEVGDGYGRRINISAVNFNRNGVVSPSGNIYMEDPAITNMYGNDGGRPRHSNEIFEDIENVNELAEAGYERYLELSRPQLILGAEVAQIGDVGIGDSVVAIRREHNLYIRARVHKLKVDLLNIEDAEVVLGDYAHFKETKVERRTRERNNQRERRNNSRITQLKLEFDDRFDGEVAQFKADFEQALIDAHAEIQAAEVRMTDRIETERSDMMNEFERQVTDTREYAEQQAQDRADSVRNDLTDVTSSHQGMIDDLKSDVLSIDDFIGPKDRTLTDIINEQRIDLEQKIEVYSRNHPNLVVGSTLENIDGFEPYGETEIELRTNESLNYIRTYPIRDGANSYYYPDTVYLEQGNTYTLGIDFRSDDVEDLDYIYFMGPYNNVQLSPIAQTRGLEADGTWHRYYFTFDWTNSTRQARLMVGTNFAQGSTERGWFDTRQVHLYEGDVHNIPWTPSPSDNAQVVSQMLHEIRRLDDGMQSLATKTELNLLTNEFTTFTNEYIETSEYVERTLTEHDNWLNANGATVTQAADLVQSKVWMNDFSNINANLIPFNDVSNVDNRARWDLLNAQARAGDSFGEFVVRSTNSGSTIGVQSTVFDVREGDPIVLSAITRTSESWGTHPQFTYTYLINENGSNQYLGSPSEFMQLDSVRRRNVWKNTANFTGKARILLGTYTLSSGADVRFSFREPKLEIGTERTAYMNAFSNIEQLANQIALQVQELDGEFLSQSDVVVRPDYVQLGSQRLGDNQLASILRVSPNSIDAITDELNLTGNLNVKGQIETISLEAIEGQFARLWADQFEAITIDVDDISGLTARFEWLYTLNANIERLVSQNVFANGVSAISLEAVHADLTSVNSVIMDTNILKADWIQGGRALFDKVFINNAMVERLTAKSAFIRDVEAISLDAYEVNIQTLMNKMGEIEGGLNITRYDGIRWVEQGVPRGNVPVQTYDSYAGADIHFNGLNYITDSSFWQTFKYFYTPHEGRTLRVVWAVGLLGSTGSASEYVEVRVEGFGNNNQINMGQGSSGRNVYVSRGSTAYVTQDIPMTGPNYNMMQAYLRVRRSPSGTGVRNSVYARILHIGQYD